MNSALCYCVSDVIHIALFFTKALFVFFYKIIKCHLFDETQHIAVEI